MTNKVINNNHLSLNGHENFNEQSKNEKSNQNKHKKVSASLQNDLPINKNRISSEIRIKNKNKHSSKSVEFPEDQTNGFSTADLSASLPDHSWFEGHTNKNFSKKYSKNSRRSRGGRTKELSKKGGANGKGTWGKLVDVEETIDDPYDINYDSDNQENCELIMITPPLTDDEIDRHVTSLITEYYENGDTEEVVFSLQEFNFDKKEYQIIVIAVSLAMDHKPSYRELTSVLISDLNNNVLKLSDYEHGFKILIKTLPDLILDTPDAPIVLGCFITRAIADNCLLPSFIDKLKENSQDCEYAKLAIEHASSLIGSKSSIMKLKTVWEIPGGMRPLKALITRIQLLLKEYISFGDLEEATRSLKELEIPHFHHEFVYEAIIFALKDMKDRSLDLIAQLLEYLYKTIVITIEQLTNGFNRVYDEFSEIATYIPLAYSLIEKLVNRCAKKGFMPKELLQKMPTRGRKRFISEGDGGRFKEDS